MKSKERRIRYCGSGNLFKKLNPVIEFETALLEDIFSGSRYAIPHIDSNLITFQLRSYVAAGNFNCQSDVE